MNISIYLSIYLSIYIYILAIFTIDVIHHHICDTGCGTIAFFPLIIMGNTYCVPHYLIVWLIYPSIVVYLIYSFVPKSMPSILSPYSPYISLIAKNIRYYPYIHILSTSYRIHIGLYFIIDT